MTQKIYETDSYVQSFTARVLQCSPAPGGFAVVLDRTAFFPEGGGQPCDTGTLGGARVLAVSTDGETVTHTTDAPLPEGTEVTGCLNWAARLDAMQQHTGEHILSGTLHRLFHLFTNFYCSYCILQSNLFFLKENSNLYSFFYKI